MKRTPALPAAALAAVLALAGCGGSDHDMSTMSPAAGASTAAAPSASGPSGSQSPTGTAPAAAGALNDADTAFLTGMIPHHRQAVQMAELAATRAGDPKVKALAAKIGAAQGPEITTMSGLLKAAGKPVPAEDAPAGDHAGMGHSTGDMGMASEEDMTELEGATGPGFDRMFLQLMTRHHQGAVQMARTQQASGKHPEVKALARTVAADQTREIAEMARLLGG